MALNNICISNTRHACEYDRISLSLSRTHFLARLIDSAKLSEQKNCNAIWGKNISCVRCTESFCTILLAVSEWDRLCVYCNVMALQFPVISSAELQRHFEHYLPRVASAQSFQIKIITVFSLKCAKWLLMGMHFLSVLQSWMLGNFTMTQCKARAHNHSLSNCQHK